MNRDRGHVIFSHAFKFNNLEGWQHGMNKWMQISKTLFIIVLLFSMMPGLAKASNQVDISGGVKNEYDYEEYVFITGKPVKFTGNGKDVKVTEKLSKTTKTTTFNYSLKSATGDTVKRTITYSADVKDFALIGQSTQNGKVTKATEVITIGGIKYTLRDYQFSNGLAIDQRPASDYYSGNISGRKIYEREVRKGKVERIEVNVLSKNEGYTNFWGSTETQITTQQYNYADGTVGVVENRVSSNKSRTLNYEESWASLSSFLGGYAMNTQANMVSQYKYNFGKGEQIVESTMEYNPVVERLPIPKFRDTANHYAENEIEQLYSLGIYDEDLEYFTPNLMIQRYEFTVAIGKAINLRVFEEPLKKDTTSLFKDVAKSNKDYQYLVAAYNKGVITGVSSTNFSPDGKLTREQAATILIRALGLEARAQDNQTLTKYSDGTRISNYAKAAVSVATRIGLMQGGTDGRFNPQGVLSRADASLIISRFLNYLDTDLKNNYQDDILFFN